MAAAKPKADAKDDKAGGDDAAAAAKQKKKKMMMFIGLAVLLVLISVGATFFVATKMMASKAPEAGAEAESSEHSSEKEGAETPAAYLPLKPNFTVNFDVNGRQRFLQAEITLMYREETVAQVLELHMPAIRNSLVMLLGSQNFEELQTIEGKEKLREAALEAVQEIIAKENAAAAKNEKDKDKKKEKPSNANIEQVLFTQFIMQ